mmetsp:Transcript_7808/g.9418  ORF Transcript_7808/g.9418 Transcript_7808/m.9418 type:complete len:82 (-) Transcript_7808:1212-1457(-)
MKAFALIALISCTLAAEAEQYYRQYSYLPKSWQQPQMRRAAPAAQPMRQSTPLLSNTTPPKPAAAAAATATNKNKNKNKQE